MKDYRPGELGGGYKGENHGPGPTGMGLATRTRSPTITGTQGDINTTSDSPAHGLPQHKMHYLSVRDVTDITRGVLYCSPLKKTQAFGCDIDVALI